MDGWLAMIQLRVMVIANRTLASLTAAINS